MFKVGDLVKGTEAGSEEYSHTGQDMLKAEVTAVYGDGDIEIIVLDHDYGPDYEGNIHDVEGRYFDLVSSNATGSTPAPTAQPISAPLGDYETLVALGLV
tara:strand:+ start:5374 stop:5673 length:300 start_codon:yes stop_codon:yes gene_type:complete